MALTSPDDIFNLIRKKQKERKPPVDAELADHKPEMLYIGCIDARLDPVKDIGIPQGKALIYRNIGALVPKNSGDNPESVSIGAALEFFIKHIPAEDDKVKHIVVSGHTHCGGIHYACTHAHAHNDKDSDTFLPKYLSMIGAAVRNLLGQNATKDQKGIERDAEQESVRQSYDNLMSYDVVRKAVADGRVQLHGWVIDTATQQIKELNENYTFEAMGNVGAIARIKRGSENWIG